MNMTLTHEQIESLCNLHNKSNSSTNHKNCSIVSQERSKTSNDTGCETDYRNTTNDQFHNNSGSTSISTKSYNGRNLIVNYLPQQMSELDIHKLFSLYGDVESCKLIRNKELKQSLGYAFVKYYCPESANKAIEELNGMILENKKIKVSIARPSRPEIKDANLYVGGLPANCTEDQLKQLFSNHGEIISCRVIKPQQKTADYHFGFVRFDTNLEAQKAMQAIHGKIPPKHIFPDANGPITVKFARTPNPPEFLDYRLTQSPYILPDTLSCTNNILSSISNNYNNLNALSTMSFNNNHNPLTTHSYQNIPNFPHSITNCNPFLSQVDNDDYSKSLCGRSHASYFNSLKSTYKDPLVDNNGCYKSLVNPICTASPNKFSNCARDTLTNLDTNNQTHFLLILINLPFDFTELSVYKLCSKFGPIHDVKVFLEDQVCFSTVEMNSKADIYNAATNLNGLLLSQYKPISAFVL